MQYRLRTLLIVVAIGPPLVLCSCGPKITRNNSSLIDDLSGVWTLPTEQQGDSFVTVIDGMKYTIYEKSPRGRYSVYRRGEVVGEEGVYFLQNEASYYSPYFFVEHNGYRFLIPGRHSYDKFIRTGRLEVLIEIRVADTLDFSKPPPRVSIETLGLPYDILWNPNGQEHTDSASENSKQ
jgi:hypothetical protein